MTISTISEVWNMTLTCPFCGRTADKVRFAPYSKPEGEEENYNPIYKCPACKYLFSPKPLDNQPAT